MQQLYRFVLIVLVVFLICLPVKAQQQQTAKEKGRAYFDFGVFSYEEENYKDALKNFKKALGFNPDDPYYNHYAGKTYLKLEQYDKAAAYLEKAWQIDPELMGLKYDMGYLRFKTGDYEKASGLLIKATESEPENVLAFYYAGVSLYKQGRFKQASGYFVKAAQMSPTIRANGYYYAGLSYQKTGELEKAEEMFLHVKDDPESGKLGESAAQWIKAVKYQQKLERPYSLYLKLGRRYDDNVVLDPDDIDLIPDDSDWSTLIYFSGTYEFSFGNNIKAGAGYTHYQIWYDDLDQYDLTGAIPQIYGEYKFNPLSFRLAYVPTYYWADGDSYLREHRIEPEIRWQINDDSMVRLLYTYKDATYFEDEARSGHSNEFYVDAFYLFLNGDIWITGKIGYEDYSASGFDQYWERWRVRVGATFMLPWELEFGINGEYQKKDYDNPDIIANIEREDDKYIGSLTLYRKIYYDWLGALGEYRYIKNDSNIKDFEYTRNVFTISLTASY